MRLPLSQYLQWMETNFELVFPFFILWSVARVAFFAWRRRRSGPIHPPFTQAEVRFTEKYVSGSSDKNLQPVAIQCTRRGADNAKHKATGQAK